MSRINLCMLQQLAYTKHIQNTNTDKNTGKNIDTISKIDTDKPKTNNYSPIYVCVEKEKGCYDQRINGFNCYLFDNFERATKYSNSIYDSSVRTTLIPICKWIPLIFHRPYLNYKLYTIYWNNSVTLWNQKTFR